MKLFNLPVLIYVSSIFLSLMFVAVFFSSLDIEGSKLTGDKSTTINNNYSISSIYNFYDSDAIGLITICKGVLFDKCYKDWNIGTFPSLFPSVIIYFILCIFIKNVLYIQITYAFIQFILLVILINILYRTVFPKMSLYALSISNSALTLFLIWPLYLPDIIINTNFFLPYHSGAFLNTLLALILMLKYLKTQKKTYLIWLGVIVILGSFSDSFFIVYFVLPLLISLALYIKSNKTKQIIRIIIFTILSVIVGLLSYWGLIKSKVVTVSFMPYVFENIGKSFDLAYNQFKYLIVIDGLRRYIFSLTYITIFLTICYAVYLSIKQLFSFFSKQSNIWNSYNFFILFYCASIIGAIAAPICRGIYFHEWSIRYCIFPIFLGLTNIGLICGYYFHSKFQNLVKVTSIVCVAILFIYFTLIYNKLKPFLIFSRIGSYYSGIVKATDDLSMIYPLKKGVADHWDAKHIGELSKKGNKLFTIYNTSLLGWHHGNNTKMLLFTDCNQSDTAFYNFIVLRSLNDTSFLCNFFGDNIKRVSQNGYKFYLVPDFYYDPYTGHPVLTTRNAFVDLDK